MKELVCRARGQDQQSRTLFQENVEVRKAFSQSLHQQNVCASEYCKQATALDYLSVVTPPDGDWFLDFFGTIDYK